MQAVHECECVGTLVHGQKLLVIAEDVSHPFKGQTEFVRINELGDQSAILARQSVIQPDEKAVQNPRDLLVVSTVHPSIFAESACSG